jgi:hypothetical protein
VSVTEVPYVTEELDVLNVIVVTFVALALKSVFPPPSFKKTVDGETEIAEPDPVTVAVTLGKAV